MSLYGQTLVDKHGYIPGTQYIVYWDTCGLSILDNGFFTVIHFGLNIPVLDAGFFCGKGFYYNTFGLNILDVRFLLW